MRFLFLFIISLVLNHSSYSTIRTWNATANGNWNVAGNWTGSAIPGSSDTARFDGTSTYTCALNATVNVLRFEINSGYTGTITQNSGNTVTVGITGFRQAAGTFTGNNAKIDVNGPCSLLTGTFTSTSDTLELGQPSYSTNEAALVVQSGQTFNHNSGVVHFNASPAGAVTVTRYINVNSKLTLNHARFYNAASTASWKVRYDVVDAADTLLMLGNVYISGGVSAGTMLYYGTHEVRGNITVASGSAQPASGLSVDGTNLLMNGSSNQYYADTANTISNTPYLGKATVDKPSTTKVIVPAGTGMRFPGAGTPTANTGGQTFTLTTGSILDVQGTVLQVRTGTIINGTLIVRDTGGLDFGYDSIVVGAAGAIIMKTHGNSFFKPKSLVRNNGFVYINAFGGLSGDADSVKVQLNGNTPPNQRTWYGTGSTYFVDASVISQKDSNGTIYVRSSKDSTNNVGITFTTIDTVRYSIGTNTGVIYGTGTVTSNRSTTVTLSGGSFPTNIGEGDKIIFDYDGSTFLGRDTCYIRSRDNATQVTLQLPPVYNYSGEDYAIKRAYNTIQAWEDVRNGNLVTQNTVEKGVCYNDGVLNEVTLSGSTTDATRFLWLTAAAGQRHNGTYLQGVQLQPSVGNPLVRVRENYALVEWLVLRPSNSSGVEVTLQTAGNSITLQNLVVANNGSSSTGIQLSDADLNVKIRNTAVHGFTATGTYGIYLDLGTSAEISNVSLFKNDNNIRGGGGFNTGVLKNVISAGATVNCFDGTFGGTSNYNLSSDATAPGANSLLSKTAFNQFLDTSSAKRNLHLKLGADAVNAGTDLSGLFTGDIDGTSRPLYGVWDIGAHEWANYIAARSVGTATASLYTGTGNASTNSTKDTITLSSGSFPSNIGEGDSLRIGATPQTAFIRSRESSTKIALQSALTSSETNATINLYRRYNALQDWDDGCPSSDLTPSGSNLIWKGVAYNDGEFSAGIHLANASCCPQTKDSTDANHYKWLTAASGQRHNGTPGTGATINVNGDVSSVIAAGDHFTVVEWMEVKNSIGNGSDNSSLTSYATQVIFRNNLVYNTSAYNRLGTGISLHDGNGAVQDRVFNNLFFGKAYGIMTAYNSGSKIGHLYYNNTVFNCDTGISDVSASSVPDTITNNVSLGNTKNYEFYTSAPIANYNAGESGNMPPTGSNNVTTTPYATFQDTTKGSPNLHIKTGSPAKDAGTSLSGNFTVDVDNDTRPNGASWDIGADEWYSGGDLLSLGLHAQGQTGNALTGLGAITGARLFRFKFDPHEGTRTVTSLVFSLTGVTGVVNGDFTNVKIYVDDNGNGLVDGSETATVGGAGTVSVPGSTITFSTGISVTAVTHYILTADLANLWYADGFTLALTTANITTTSSKDGICAGVTHNNVTINARSIGTQASAFTTGGTLNTSTNGTNDTLTTTGSYPANIGEGDSIRFTGSGQTGFILSRVSGTKIALISALASSETNQTINIYRRYNTLSGWESNREGNLITRNAVEKGVCYNDGDLTAGVTIDGSTTDSSHYLWLTAASGQRHNGTAAQGITVTSDVNLLDDYSVVEWLDISTNNDNDINANYVTFRNCLIHGTGSGIGINIPYIYYYHYCKLYNNIVYQKSDGIRNVGGSGSNYHNLIFNNTVYKCTNGIKDTGNWTFYDTLRNNVSVGNTTNYLLDGNQVADYNAGESGNMPNQGTHNVSTTAFESFVDTVTATRNLHLKRNSICLDAGTSLSSYFTKDIDDTTTRPLGPAWDLGADERLFSTDSSQWYVDYRNGTDGAGRGKSFSLPAKTIEWVYDQFPDVVADSVYVINLLPGSHIAANAIDLDANGPTFVPRSPLIIRSYYPGLDSIPKVAATTLAAGMGVFAPSVNYVILDHLLIRGSADAGENAIGVGFTDASSGNFRNITVKNCIFDLDSTGGVDSYHMAFGVRLKSTDSVFLYNNVFKGKGATAQADRGIGAWLEGNGARIINNTFYKTSYAWDMEKAASAPAKAIFANNLFDSLYYTIKNGSGALDTFTFLGNAFYNMALPIGYVSTGNPINVTSYRNKYPATRPVAAYDYSSTDFAKLAKGSVLIDSAYDTSGTPSKDFYGLDSVNKRDIGACEYNSKKDLFYADTVHLFVDYDKADNTGDGRTIAAAKKNVQNAYDLIPSGTVDSTYVINLLPSSSAYQGSSGSRSLTVDGSVKTFPSWTKSLVVQSYYPGKDSFAVLGNADNTLGLIYLLKTVRHVHVKRLRFIKLNGTGNTGAALNFEKFSAGEVIRSVKISECVFDTANTGDWDSYLRGVGAFLDSVDVYNCYFGGNSSSGNYALDRVFTDSSASYGIRLVNNTFHRLEYVFYNCDNAGKQHFKLMNNVISYSGVVGGGGGDTWSANTYANWNCYFNATSIAPSPVTQGTDTLVRDPKIQSFTWSNSAFAKLGDDSPVIGFGKDSVEFSDGKIHYVTPRYDLFAIKREPKIDLGCAQYDPSSIAGKRIFQEGVHGGDYGAAEDAQLYGFDATYKTYNYGGKVSMEVRGGSPFKSLIRYPSFSGKVSSLQVPSNAHVDSAFLYLYCTQGASGDAEVYRVTRSWTEGTADGATQSGSVTWNAAKSGTTNWGTEGVDNLNDREPVSVSTNAAIGTNSWERWDVSALVQDWVSGVTNYGLLLSDQNSDMNLAAKFHTSEYSTDKTLRPKLVVYFDEDTVTVVHQAGTVTSTEVEDTYLNEAASTNNYGASTGLRLQTGASARMHPLVNFTKLKGNSGSNQIPYGATVTSAELTLYRSDADAGLDANESYAHRVTQLWEEGAQGGAPEEASWDKRYQTLGWSSGGALGSTDHDAAAPSAGNTTGSTIGQGIVWKADTAAVDWAGGAENYGVLVKPTGTIATAIDFYSSEGTSSVSSFYNPKFKATYYGSGGNEGNTPWKTPNYPLLKLYTSVTGPVTVDSFYQAKGDGSGATDDSYIALNATSTNWGGVDSLRLRTPDGTNNRRTLIKSTNFVGSGGGQIPQGAVIDSAIVRLVEENSTLDADILVDVYRINESWTEGTANPGAVQNGSVTWNSRVHNTSTWGNAGAGTPTSATRIYQNVTLTRKTGNGGVNDTVFVPATRFVQEWVNFPTQNHGLMIDKISGGTNHNYFFSSEDADAGDQPRLIVWYHLRQQIEVQNVGRYATENNNFASADSLKNQFFLSFHTKTDSTDGMLNQWKTAATSPGQRIKGSYDLLPSEVRHFNLFNILRRQSGGNWSYYADSVRSSATLSWSVVESTTTRMRYRINGRTLYDGGSFPRNINAANEITIYPTGQIFIWDSARAYDYQGAYDYAVYFLQKDGTGTGADDDVAWGGLYSTASGNQTLHDFVGALLSHQSSAYTFPWTTSTLLTNITTLSSGGNYKGVSFNPVSDFYWNSNVSTYYQNFMVDFSTDDANHSDSLKRLYEDKRYPASMNGFRTGSAKTNASGDLNADGFNEKEGCYELTADNGEAYFWFNTASPRPHYYPVFKLNNYTYNAAPSAVYLITPDEAIIDTLEASKGDVNISLLTGNIVIFQLNRHIDAGCVIYVGPRNTLAVEMGEFWGEADSGTCRLYWRTESEKDNVGFNLYRRTLAGGKAARRSWLDAGQEDGFHLVKSYQWDERMRGQLTKALRTEYGVEDNAVKLGERYEYALESVDLNGNVKRVENTVRLTVDKSFRFDLGQNFPNPFNPATAIRYQVPGKFSSTERPLVHLRVFNIRGQLIRDLVSSRQRPDRYTVLWNGKANKGRYVGSGVYFYRLEVGQAYRKTRKMIVVK